MMINNMEDLVYEFNYLPANYLHDSWWVELQNGGVLKLLRGKRRVEKKLSKIIIEYFELDVDYHCQFNGYVSRIALLSLQEINDLVYNLGLLYAGHQVNQVIIKSKLEDYNELIGENKYSFVRNAAPKMREVLGITEPAFVPEIKFEQLPAYMHTVGMNLLSKALSQEDSQYKVRLMLKLGVQSDKYFNNEDITKVVDMDINPSQLIVEALMRHCEIEFENSNPSKKVA